MSRWEDEGVAYKRTQNWTLLPHGDECIFIANVFGNMMIQLDYENGTISFQKVATVDGQYEEITYFPIEEMEEIVGHMKNTMKRRRKRFEESTK